MLSVTISKALEMSPDQRVAETINYLLRKKHKKECEREDLLQQIEAMVAYGVPITSELLLRISRVVKDTWIPPTDYQQFSL